MKCVEREGEEKGLGEKRRGREGRRGKEKRGVNMTINGLFFCLVWREDKLLRCMRMQMRLFGPFSVVFYCKTSIINAV